MPRILITGSRDWPAKDIHVITQVLGDAILKYIKDGYTRSDIVIVHGACPKGADAMADWIAGHWGMPIERHPADWSTYGMAAGPVRNKMMVDTGVDICLAFVYNKSRGASNTVSLCRKCKVPVILITN